MFCQVILGLGGFGTGHFGSGLLRVKKARVIFGPGQVNSGFGSHSDAVVQDNFGSRVSLFRSAQSNPVAFARSTQASVDFQPSCWGDYFLHVIPLDEATKQEMEEEIGNLREEVKKELLATVEEPTKQLELVDAIERLGVAYHFETNIEEILDQLYKTYLKENDKYNLHHVSLGFRIFRQHGFNVSCDVFKRFMSNEGFQDNISNDIEGILSMYEACHVAIHEDDILQEALELTTTLLRSLVDQLKSPMADQIEHALHQPLHKGIIRLESKHFISFYQQNPTHNKTLLRLAKLDYNLIQSLHQMELRELVRWWKGVHAKLPFTRDRSVECQFWVVGCYYEPKYALARKILSRMNMILQMFDDFFDSYGTIEEKQLLVQAVYRWDYSYVDQLPKYFNECYKTLLDSFVEAEQDVEKQGESFGIRYCKEQMKINCEAWFQEAKWCKSNHIPTYDEYIEVALVSVAQTTIIIAAYLGMGEIATKEAYEWVSQNSPMPKVVKACSIILRLMNDIGGHKFEQDREHVASSVECYMKQHGISNEIQVYDELENHVKDAWKDINEGMLKPYAIPKALLERILFLARVTDTFYKGRTDGYTFVNETIQQKIASILIDPVPL
ncbi:putative sesquiterpene synthase [Silene latifolia]|uniref:putative sesquiterpene synthase n=1 Tax=Silene latifolia TaxID=37657 RepID=UPI003D770D1C